MALASAAAPTDRGRGYLLEAAGLGRRRQRLFEAMAVAGLAGTLLAGGWAVLATKQSADRVQRVVVFLNPETGIVLGQSPIGSAADPVLLDRAYLRVAMDWVTLLRSRPQDADSFNKAMVDLAKLTDIRQWNRLGDELAQKREEFGQSVIEVTKVSANIVERRADGTAIANVYWTQVKKSGIRSETSWRATLRLLYRKDDTGLDFRRNVLGVYVMDAQITQEG